MTFPRPMEIYMDTGVSLLCFKYPATLKKLYQKCNSINYIFPNYVFHQIYPFPYTKNKNKEFYCCCYVVKFYLQFSFFIFPPFQCLSVSLVMRRIFFISQVARIFFIQTLQTISSHSNDFQYKSSCEYFQHLQLKEPSMKPFEFCTENCW